MADGIFIAVIVVFFGLCVLYIRACERILRNAEEPIDSGESVTR